MSHLISNTHTHTHTHPSVWGCHVSYQPNSWSKYHSTVHSQSIMWQTNKCKKLVLPQLSLAFAKTINWWLGSKLSYIWWQGFDLVLAFWQLSWWLCSIFGHNNEKCSFQQVASIKCFMLPTISILSLLYGFWCAFLSLLQPNAKKNWRSRCDWQYLSYLSILSRVITSQFISHQFCRDIINGWVSESTSSVYAAGNIPLTTKCCFDIAHYTRSMFYSVYHVVIRNFLFGT